MLNQLRTYRIPTRFLAMVLLIASVLPFVGHVCTMVEANAMPMLDPCSAATHHGHEGMDGMDAQCGLQHESHQSNHGNQLQDTCCTSVSQALVANATARTYAVCKKQVSFALVNLSSVPSQNFPRFHTGIFKDLGPPALSTPPLHILFEQILN